MKPSVPVRTFLSLSLVALALPTVAHARGAQGGDISGGGGNSVVCFDDESIPPQVRKLGDVGPFLDKIRSIEMFDLHEARLPYGAEARKFPDIIPVLPEEKGHEWKYVERIRARVAPYVPAFESALRATERLLGADGTTPCTDNLQHGNITCQDAPVEPIHDLDSAGSFDSRHCVLVTTAVNHIKDGKAYLTFDRRILNHPANSAISRATLFMHELVYIAARAFDGQSDSRRTRDLLAVLMDRSTPLTLGPLLDAIDATDILSSTDPAPSELAESAAELMAETAKKAYLANPADQRTHAVGEALERAERKGFLEPLAAMPWVTPGYRSTITTWIEKIRTDLTSHAATDPEETFRFRAADVTVVQSTKLLVSWMDDPELQSVIVPVEPTPLPPSLEFMAAPRAFEIATEAGVHDANSGSHTVHAIACFDDPTIARRAQSFGGMPDDEAYSHLKSVQTLALALSASEKRQLARINPGESPLDFVARIARERIQYGSPELSDPVDVLTSDPIGRTPHLHDYIEAIPADPKLSSLIQGQGRPDCAIVPLARIYARKRYGCDIRTRIDADDRLLEFGNGHAMNEADLLLEASWAMQFPDGDERSDETPARLAAMLLSSDRLTVKQVVDAIHASAMDLFLDDGASYPAMLAKRIVEEMVDAVPSGPQAVDAVYSAGAKSSWRSLVLGIPGAPKDSVEKLDRYLLDWAAKVRAQKPDDVNDDYTDTIPDDVDGFFDLDYPLPPID